MKIAFFYLFAVSFISATVCVYDKIAAKKGLRRIRESSLMFLSFLGGSFAMYITMRIIRHKTRHTKFMLGIPIMIILQISALAVISQFL